MIRTLLLVALALCACKKPDLAPEAGAKKAEWVSLPPVKVQTAAIEHQKMPRYLTLVGSVYADRQSEVAANVSGRVTNTYVERGVPVKLGQVIAVVDSRAAGFQVAAAVAQSQAAQMQVTWPNKIASEPTPSFPEPRQVGVRALEEPVHRSAVHGQRYQATPTYNKAARHLHSGPRGIVGERHQRASTQPPTRWPAFAVNPVRVSLSVPEPAYRW